MFSDLPHGKTFSNKKVVFHTVSTINLQGVNSRDLRGKIKTMALHNSKNSSPSGKKKIFFFFSKLFLILRNVKDFHQKMSKINYLELNS